MLAPPSTRPLHLEKKLPFFSGSKKPEKLHSAGRILAQGLVTWYTYSTIRTDVRCIYPRRGTCFHVMQSFELEA